MHGIKKRIKIITNVNTVAQVFLSFETMSHKKLQKLCYYAYSILLANTNGKQKLFTDKIEAWIHGPVMPTLYSQYRKYSLNEEIKKHNCPISNDSSLYQYLQMIFKIFGKYSGSDLEEMTHRGKPWLNAREGLGDYDYSRNIIKDKDIIEHFNQYE